MRTSAPMPTAVVLFNLGGPDDLDSVEPFLVKLFSDREIIELPLGASLQPVMARVIARLRGPSVRRNYERIGGGSPQLRLTLGQAVALEERLNVGAGDTQPYRVFIAMRYSRPSAEEALRAIARTGIRRIVALTLFPHYSKATTGSSLGEFTRVLARPDWRRFGFEVSHIDRYPDDPKYLDAMAATVRSAWERIPSGRRESTVILFSAHGLPQRFIDQGDPYVAHIESTRRGILDRLSLGNRQLLAYQSRTGPVKWIGPGTEETLVALGREGVKDVLVVPLSFVSDHIETLYEVDLLFAEAARSAGITGYYRPEALNSHPLFIDALASLVSAHVRLCAGRCCGCQSNVEKFPLPVFAGASL
ncbi:MAG TPA: ferrochelatase [Vicinamibacterales bacterium]|jgi:protoporphyrin/coproporphyrin ferrochelatase|nr:ferrochelatase [Vicinamibacterales bacterium]